MERSLSNLGCTGVIFGCQGGSQVLYLVAQGSYLAAQGSYLAAQGSYLAAQGSYLAAQGSYLVAQGPYLAAQDPVILRTALHAVQNSSCAALRSSRKLSMHEEAWPRPCEARPQATGHGKNFYTQRLEDVQH